jgi:hypothetical protein
VITLLFRVFGTETSGGMPSAREALANLGVQ